MKNIKRILLAFVAVFGKQSSWWHVVPKVIMGLMSTNHQNRTQENFEEQGLSGSQLESIGDVINFEVSIKIKDSKGTLSIAGEVAGQKNERSYDVKINQKRKTIASKDGSGEKDYIQGRW